MLIGIDLGLTMIRSAWAEGGQATLIESLTGKRALPAAVGIERGELHVGESARNQHLLYPERAATRIRRLLGTSQRIFLEDKSFSAPELIAVLLNQVREDAEERLGKRVTELALAIPTHFAPEQRRAAESAAALAGFHSIKLLLEPLCIAAAYGVTATAATPEASDGPAPRILVCDLGAKHCDAAILGRREADTPGSERAASKAELSILSSGSVGFGCEDGDPRIVSHLLHLYEREYGLSPRGNRKAQARLRMVAEWARCELSRKESISIRVPGLMTIGNSQLDLLGELSREQLDLLIEDDLRKCLEAVELALREARLQPSEVSTVLLSGGGARSPCFQRLLSELLATRPLDTIPPEEAIARGAALLGSEPAAAAT